MSYANPGRFRRWLRDCLYEMFGIGPFGGWRY